jgi:hypothetical protein
MQFPTITPEAIPTPTAAPLLPSPSPVPATQEEQTATIRATVYVRAEPDAASRELGGLETGQIVEIVECTGDWCEIVPLPEWKVEQAFVFRGCLSDNPEGLRCEVRE